MGFRFGAVTYAIRLAKLEVAVRDAIVDIQHVDLFANFGSVLSHDAHCVCNDSRILQRHDD